MGRPAAGTFKIATPKRLLSAAESVFGRRGFEGARLEDVARYAGISRPSLLYHYPTKKVLYAAVVRKTFSELAGAIGAAMLSSGDFPARVENIVAAFSKFTRERPALASIILREFLDGRGPGRRILTREIAPVLRSVERFARSSRRLRAGLPIRAAILKTASNILLNAVAGPLRRVLWGAKDHSRELARVLFVS